MQYWLRLASRAAFRKGTSRYCGYDNTVEPGMWAGGIVGLKSILGIKSRGKALKIMDELQELGYLTWTLDADTKKLTYKITDWVVKCSGAECQDGVVYTTPGYGFLCMPRNITERLAEKGYKFDEADAWLDLWCHTVFQDYGNAFSFLAPAVQYGKYDSVLTLETLGQRWGWEKTKVWRFFHKLEGCFPIYRLSGEDALEKSVTAAKLSESVTLKTRALPAHTGHPKTEAMAWEVVEESVPVEIGFTEQGWLKIQMPILLPRKEKSSRSYIRGFLYPALEKFAFSRDKIRYRNCVLIFCHVYDRNRPEREYRDHDNIELNTVVDAIALFFLVDDTPLECRHYYCSAAGDAEKTEVYIVPRAEFRHWLDMENDPPKIRKIESEKSPVDTEKDTEIQPFLRKSD